MYFQQAKSLLSRRDTNMAVFNRARPVCDASQMPITPAGERAGFERLLEDLKPSSSSARNLVLVPSEDASAQLNNLPRAGFHPVGVAKPGFPQCGGSRGARVEGSGAGHQKRKLERADSGPVTCRRPVVARLFPPSALLGVATRRRR
jgi:hypothetical protein